MDRKSDKKDIPELVSMSKTQRIELMLMSLLSLMLKSYPLLKCNRFLEKQPKNSSPEAE